MASARADSRASCSTSTKLSEHAKDRNNGRETKTVPAHQTSTFSRSIECLCGHIRPVASPHTLMQANAQLKNVSHFLDSQCVPYRILKRPVRPTTQTAPAPETTSISGNLIEGITELIVQPAVVRISTGSGNSDNTLDHDKNKQRKGGRRRRKQKTITSAPSTRKDSSAKLSMP